MGTVDMQTAVPLSGRWGGGGAVEAQSVELLNGHWGTGDVETAVPLGDQPEDGGSSWLVEGGAGRAKREKTTRRCRRVNQWITSVNQWIRQ